MTEDIPGVISAFPDSMKLMVAVMILGAFVIAALVYIITAQHKVIMVKNNSDLLLKIAANQQDEIRLLTSIHSIVSRRKGSSA